MTKTKILLGILVAALVFGAVFIGCGGGSDSITSYDVDGTWVPNWFELFGGDPEYPNTDRDAAIEAIENSGISVEAVLENGTVTIRVAGKELVKGNYSTKTGGIFNLKLGSAAVSLSNIYQLARDNGVDILEVLEEDYLLGDFDPELQKWFDEIIAVLGQKTTLYDLLDTKLSALLIESLETLFDDTLLGGGYTDEGGNPIATFDEALAITVGECIEIFELASFDEETLPSYIKNFLNANRAKTLQNFLDTMSIIDVAKGLKISLGKLANPWVTVDDALALYHEVSTLLLDLGIFDQAQLDEMNGTINGIKDTLNTTIPLDYELQGNSLSVGMKYEDEYAEEGYYWGLKIPLIRK